MSGPSAVPIGGGITAGDLVNASDEVLLALLRTDPTRARQIIGMVPARYVAGAPSRILTPGLPQFINMHAAALAGAFR